MYKYYIPAKNFLPLNFMAWARGTVATHYQMPATAAAIHVLRAAPELR